MYRCLNCRRELTFEDISGMPFEEYAKEVRRSKLRCPDCGYRILRKVRPDKVKIIKAR